MSRKTQKFISFIILLLFAVAPITAQVTTGSLQGIVKDPNGAVVAGATIKITNTETGASRETQTNSEGYYRVTNLLPGDKYKIDISASGFASQTLENIAVRLATENSLDAQLNLQGATGVVTVTDTGEIIQTTQNQLKTDFSQKQLTQLPLNGGSIDNLALLVPGVLTPGDTDFTNGVGISANGNRGRSNNFQIDGQDNNDNSVAGPTLSLTNTDAIGEFQVITNNFSAEFGRNSGAQINTITKAGKNDISGTTFWNHNNQALDALNNFQKVNAKTFKFMSDNGVSDFQGLANRGGKNPYSLNQIGGSLGGPIKKDKAFFFITYEGTYNRGETVSNGLASGLITFDKTSATLAAQLFPNAATKQLTSTAIGGGPAFIQGAGQFLIAPPTIDFNGDGIPETFVWGAGNPFGLTPTANRLQPSLFVRDGGGNLRTLYTGEAVRMVRADSSNDQIITREDFNLTDKDMISARYIFNNSRNPLATGRSLAGALFDVPSKNHNLGVTYTRTLSSNWVNEARFNYSSLNIKFGDPNGTLPGPGIGFSGQRDLAGSFGSIAFGTQNNLPQSRKVVVYQEQDTLSSTIGNHAIKFGFDFRQQRTENFFLPNFLGTYTFRGGSVAGTIPANTFYEEDGTSRAGQPALAFENLLLNRPRDINFAVGSPKNNIDQNDYFLFFQDDWRAKSNLTLNLGFRYEVSTQPFNKINEKVNVREADTATAVFSTAFPLASRTAKNIPLDKNNWAPRLGFAWSPNFDFFGDRFSNGKTVIRGGVGVSYDPGFFNIVLNTITAAPYVGAGFIRQNDPGLPGSVGIPFLPNTTALLSQTPGTNGGDPRLFNQTRVSDDFHNPYTISYNFGIQQELWRNTVLEVRYVGTQIKDQFQTLNGNPDLRFLAAAGAYFGDAAKFTNGLTPGVNAGTNGNGRVDPTLGITRLRTNGAHGQYDGLQTEFRTRYTNLSLNFNYTFSKTMDNASEIFGSVGGGQTLAASQNPFDTDRGEWGLSAFHQKHNVTANFVYELPYYKSQSGFVGKLLGGFQLTGIMRMGSGRAYTPINLNSAGDPNFENTFLGSGVLRPYNGSPTAPVGTIAFGANAAANVFGDTRAAAGQFIVYNTLSPGSNGVVVTQAQALQQARLFYNDFGLFSQFGIPLASLEAFNLFKSPFGNVGRNTFFGNPFYQTDLSVLKRTNLNERMKLEFRAEFQNAFNQRNFGVPNVLAEAAYTAYTGTIGVVSGFQNPGFNPGSSRSVRLGMKFIF